MILTIIYTFIIKILIAAGDRDIGPDKGDLKDYIGFVRQNMEDFFYFEYGGRYWFSLDSNPYLLSNSASKDRRKAQRNW